MLWALIFLAAAMIAIPVLVHAVLRRYVVASLASAALVAITSAVVFTWGRFTVEGFALTTAATAPAAFVIALGVGIPFNRRRNPMPEQGLPGSFLKRVFTRRMSVLELVLGLVFALIFFRALQAMIG